MRARRVLAVGTGATVAFQGELGAFSHRAVHQICGTRIEPVPCPSFEEVFERVTGGRTDLAVIPIENSLAGSIHQNFDLLARHRLEAVGETYVRIEHHLIAHRGATLRTIRRVYSHPVALAQCQRFLRRLRRVEKVPFYDTAGSVKHVREQVLTDAAAIASAQAARLYGLQIVRRNVEDDRQNYTRFLALARRGRFPAGGGKTSIVFGLRNEPGALFKALSVFSLRDIDLTKIESRPIHGHPWEYLFYIDLRGDVRAPQCRNALRHLAELALHVQVLGCYPTF